MSLTIETQTSSIPSLLEDRLRDRCRTLQVMPEVATKAIEITKKPDCSFIEFSRVVDRDAKLASDILCIANSAMFAAAQPILVLHQAVVRLGLRQCRNLIVSSCMAALSKSTGAADNPVQTMLCRHGFTTGVIATGLNASLRLGFQGEEFAAALMHDFGRTLLALCLPDQFAAIDPMTFDESLDMLTREREIAGVSHCEVGAWFADHKRLPAEFKHVMLFHHEPARATESAKLVALISAADDMANHLARGLTADAYNFAACPALPWLLAEGVNPDAEASVREILSRANDAAASMMQL